MERIAYNLGEMNRIMASAKYLVHLSLVDETKSYLHRHRPCNALSSLISEITSQAELNLFKSVISFGAIAIITNHHLENETEAAYALQLFGEKLL